MLTRSFATMAASLMPAAVLAYKQIEMIELNPPSVEELSIIDEVGRAPCVFKVGDSFYDFTPLKLID